MLVKWAGFPYEECSFEDPVDCHACDHEEVDDYVAVLLELNGVSGL